MKTTAGDIRTTKSTSKEEMAPNDLLNLLVLRTKQSQKNIHTGMTFVSSKEKIVTLTDEK